MNNLLYYPGFEIQDEAWLKFALLYLEKINTIVPKSAENDLSSYHKYILDKTDLLGSYSPDFDESEKATDDAIETIEKIVDNPIRYWRRFGKVKYLDFWRDKKQHKFEIYHEKYSDYFVYFCMENGFATKSNKGIKVPEDLGLIYMSLLAYSIKNNKGYDIISDSKRISRLRSISNQTWQKNKKLEELTALRSFVDLAIPTDIIDIPIQSIIELRNKSSYKKKLNAFHKIVDKFNTVNQLDKFNVHELKTEVEYRVKDIKSDIITLGTSVASVTLGTYIAVDNSMMPIELLKELIGVGFVIGGVIQLYPGIRNINNKRLAKSYLTELKKLTV
ncbi:hypothetical protein [Brassicibacter mesophilus]|uniref:hypothetical protein n=1 Tax=Brassicibacter mesophilus TaxID=745119 RepID=UPI003D1A9F8B